MTHPDSLRPAAKLSDTAERLLSSPHRLEILQLLQHHGPLASKHLAELAGTTRNAINRHISGLLDDGWIKVTGTSTGRGRPERLIDLAEEHDWTALIDEINRRAEHLQPADSEHHRAL